MNLSKLQPQTLSPPPNPAPSTRMHTCWTNAKYVDLALKVYAPNLKT